LWQTRGSSLQQILHRPFISPVSAFCYCIAAVVSMQIHFIAKSA